MKDANSNTTMTMTTTTTTTTTKKKKRKHHRESSSKKSKKDKSTKKSSTKEKRKQQQQQQQQQQVKEDYDDEIMPSSSDEEIMEEKASRRKSRVTKINMDGSVCYMTAQESIAGVANANDEEAAATATAVQDQNATPINNEEEQAATQQQQQQQQPLFEKPKSALQIARERLERKLMKRREKYSKGPPQRTIDKDELDVASKQQIEILYGSIKFSPPKGLSSDDEGGLDPSSFYDSLTQFDDDASGSPSSSLAKPVAQELPDSYFDNDDGGDEDGEGSSSSPSRQLDFGDDDNDDNEGLKVGGITEDSVADTSSDRERLPLGEEDNNGRKNNVTPSLSEKEPTTRSSPGEEGQEASREAEKHLVDKEDVARKEESKTTTSTSKKARILKTTQDEVEATSTSTDDDIVQTLKRSLSKSPKKAKRKSVDVEAEELGDFPVKHIHIESFNEEEEESSSNDNDNKSQDGSSSVSLSGISAVTCDDALKAPPLPPVKKKKESAKRQRSVGTMSTKEVSTIASITSSPVAASTTLRVDEKEKQQLEQAKSPRKGKKMISKVVGDQETQEGSKKTMKLLDDEEMGISRPEQVREQGQRSTTKKSRTESYEMNRKFKWWALLYMFIAILGIGAIVYLLYWFGIIGSRDNSTQSDTTVVPTSAPSQWITQQPTSSTYTLVAAAVLAEFGMLAYSSLQDMESPQAKAARWIGDIDEIVSFPLNDDDDVSSLRFRQRYTLAVLYYSTGGSETWVTDLGFLSNSHECSWKDSTTSGFGVTCMDGIFITEIEISSHNLVGSIPPEIGGLSELQRLVLDDNDIRGTLPETFYRLTNLREFSLAKNALSGSLSTAIGNLGNLESIRIDKSKMTGTLPAELGNLSRLQTLVLAKSSFQDKIPSGIRYLTALTTLDLGDNFLSGNIPQWIPDLPLLQRMDVSLNKLTGTIPEGRFQSLEELVIDSNRLTGTIPSFIFVPSLRVLNLRNNKFSGSLPTSWLAAPLLTMIDVSDNTLSGSLSPLLGSLFNLKSLYATDCGLTGTLPQELGRTLLEELDVEGNLLDGSVPENFAQLPLEYFAIGRNMITGDLNFLCDIPSTPFLSADCPLDVQCSCCSRCFDENKEEIINNVFGNR